MLNLLLILSLMTNAVLVVSFFLLKRHLKNIGNRVQQIKDAQARPQERIFKRLAQLISRCDSMITKSDLNSRNIDILVESLRSVLNAQDRSKFDEGYDRIPNKIAEYD